MTLHETTAKELQDIQDAVDRYRAKVAELQAGCKHPTVLKYYDWGSHYTWRVCEDCGVCQRAWHDSYNARLAEKADKDSTWSNGWFTDSNLMGRAYDVDWTTMAKAQPKRCDGF